MKKNLLLLFVIFVVSFFVFIFDSQAALAGSCPIEDCGCNHPSTKTFCASFKPGEAEYIDANECRLQCANDCLALGWDRGGVCSGRVCICCARYQLVAKASNNCPEEYCYGGYDFINVPDVPPESYPSFFCPVLCDDDIAINYFCAPPDCNYCGFEC